MVDAQPPQTICKGCGRGPKYVLIVLVQIDIVNYNFMAKGY
jgi:hypothetical protein